MSDYRPLTREQVEQAMRDNPPGWGDSRDHPIYARDAIRNPLATQPADDEAEDEPEPERR